MASLYQRKGSPYWWVKFRDKDGKLCQESTGFKFGNAPDARRAQAVRAEKELEELKYAPSRGHGAWATWVPQFLSVKYGGRKTRTLDRYMECWRPLAMFLEEHDIHGPAQFNREHCFTYIGWRMKPDLLRGKYKAGRNTAIHDLKIMRLIMTEAVVRGFAQGNPCIGLNLERAEAKVKSEFTEEQMEHIRRSIETIKDLKHREFFRTSFEIARYQGCRISETRLNPLTQVDIPNQTIYFRIKGARMHSTLLHPKLIPFFEQLKAEGRTTTWQKPASAAFSWASVHWRLFLDRIGLKGYSFHCLRVTASTRMARDKVPENIAQKFIGHASTTVHRGYIRFRPEDLGDAAKAIG